MPPQNSPNQLAVDHPETQQSPQLSPSTRLPIIRSSVDEDPDVTRWRALLDRAVNLVAEPPQDWPVNRDTQAAREEVRQRMIARRAERNHQSTMSTYRGWAPGTIELERPFRGTRNPSRHDQSRNTPTRRYRREQETHSVSRPYNEHRIDEQSEIDFAEWRTSDGRPSQHSSHPRSDATPLRREAIMGSFGRQARMDMLRDRINSFTGVRDEGYHQGRINFLDDYARLTSDLDLELSNPGRQQAAPSDETRDSALLEKHATRLFEEAIILLDGLRQCLSQADRSNLLEEAGFGAVNRAEMMANDKTLNTATVFKPQPSSWLKPGASFSGQQKACTASGTIRSNRRSSRRYEEQSNTPAVIPPSERSRPWTHGIVFADSTDLPKDCWPVKVCITSVDYHNMTLTGTMEAFNVPNPKGTNLLPRDPTISSITTYLEGEIIDLHEHSLRTTNFKAGSDVDATYWRMLEPFKSLEINQIVDGFTDMEWLGENLAKEWIVMRWKEKCFVSPSDANSGLTISGFYYITLRRSDGKVEGLYHDPNSCPYQFLDLKPERPLFPVYAFR